MVQMRKYILRSSDQTGMALAASAPSTLAAPTCHQIHHT